MTDQSKCRRLALAGNAAVPHPGLFLVQNQKSIMVELIRVSLNKRLLMATIILGEPIKMGPSMDTIEKPHPMVKIFCFLFIRLMDNKFQFCKTKYQLEDYYV